MLILHTRVKCHEWLLLNNLARIFASLSLSSSNASLVLFVCRCCCCPDFFFCPFRRWRKQAHFHFRIAHSPLAKREAITPFSIFSSSETEFSLERKGKSFSSAVRTVAAFRTTTAVYKHIFNVFSFCSSSFYSSRRLSFSSSPPPRWWWWRRFWRTTRSRARRTSRTRPSLPFPSPSSDRFLPPTRTKRWMYSFALEKHKGSVSTKKKSFEVTVFLAVLLC